MRDGRLPVSSFPLADSINAGPHEFGLDFPKGVFGQFFGADVLRAPNGLPGSALPVRLARASRCTGYV